MKGARPPLRVRQTRAPRMSVEDRQEAILDAVIPLLAVHGKELTSKQIAEAAGVAEGTIFRAFGDKDALVNAAIDRFLDPDRMRLEMSRIKPSGDLETTVLQIVGVARRRFGDIFKVMALLGHQHRPNKKPLSKAGEVIVEILSEHLPQLNLDPARAAQVIRLLTFSSTLPHLNPDHQFTDQELSSVILYGIAGAAKPEQNRN